MASDPGTSSYQNQQIYLSWNSDCYQFDTVTINEAERLIEEWLEEESRSARLPFAEKLGGPSCWLLDGRFNVQKLAKKLAQSGCVIPIRAARIGRELDESSFRPLSE